MSSGAQSFYSTPTFELFRRGLTTQTIKNFRGINAFQNVTLVSAEHALDCMNVLIPGSGGVSKFRLPVQLSDKPVGFLPVGPYQIFDFQQPNGTRQVIGTFANSLYYYTWATPTTLSAPNLIDASGTDAQPWSMVEASQLLLAANNVVMMKWTGTQWQNWGIVAPVAAPTIGSPTILLDTIQRTANVVTFTIRNHFPEATGATYLTVGDAITISNPPDVTFNGNFVIASVVTPGLTYTYAQAGANSGVFNQTALITFPTSSGVVPGIVAGSRTATVATYNWSPQLPIASTSVVGTLVTISGFADATLNGTFRVATALSSFNGTTQITVNQPGLPDSAGGVNGTLTLGVTIATSRTYAISYNNIVVGGYSNVSPTVTLPGPLTNRIVYVGGPVVFPDPQITFYQLFATLDGGADLFIDRSGLAGASGTVLADFYQDASLDPTVQGPLNNNPPPVGKYTAVGQSRVFVGNLVGDPTAIAYSGFEQILLGNPPECFPIYNRIRINIGAEGVAGLGILQAGVVAFSVTKKMYMLRGTIEDIVINAPIGFSAFLEELPWNIGTMCHQSIQATAMGLIFWATDRTVQIFSGSGKPQDISPAVYPLLRRATVGYEAQASSAYFNWLERDWYTLSFAADGSHTNNLTIIWSLNAATGEIDIFPTDIQSDSMATITTSALQRILAIGQKGKIMNLPVSQDTTGGLGDPAVIPATAGKLGAWWKSGYFGNESPVRNKMARRGLAITDQDGFAVTVRTVNNKTTTVKAPKVGAKKKLKSGAFSINDKCNRVSIEINFPDEDVSSNLLELTVGFIATSDRL